MVTSNPAGSAAHSDVIESQQLTASLTEGNPRLMPSRLRGQSSAHTGYLEARQGGWSTSRPGRFTHRKEILHPTYRRLGGLSAPVRTGPQNLAPTGTQILDRLAFSESFYRQSHSDRPSLPNAQK
jgi:hypothetical protein